MLMISVKLISVESAFRHFSYGSQLVYQHRFI